MNKNSAFLAFSKILPTCTHVYLYILNKYIHIYTRDECELSNFGPSYFIVFQFDIIPLNNVLKCKVAEATLLAYAAKYKHPLIRLNSSLWRPSIFQVTHC